MALAFVCTCASATEPAERPALLVEPSAQARAELIRAVSSALDRPPVTIAADALTASSELVVDRVRPRGPWGEQLSGRDYGRPEHFRLVTDGARCTLVHERSGKRIVLTESACKPAP